MPSIEDDQPTELIVIRHGANPDVPRPPAGVVRWIGSVAPTHAAVDDEFTDTVNKVSKLHNGTGFDTLGSAASGAGTPTVRAFPFTFDTPDLVTGATVFVPTVGDILLDGWIEVVTAWNGTTPQGDFGGFTSGFAGWLSCIVDVMDMAVPDDTVNWWFGPPLRSGGGGGKASSLAMASYGLATASTIPRTVPGRFATADPVKVCVSTTGAINGADPGATQGAAILFLVTATPSPDPNL